MKKSQCHLVRREFSCWANPVRYGNCKYCERHSRGGPCIHQKVGRCESAAARIEALRAEIDWCLHASEEIGDKIKLEIGSWSK